MGKETGSLDFPLPPGPNHPPVFYPGAKARWKPVLRQLIGKPPRLVSPFLGGGSVEIDTCCRGIPVLAADINQDLVDFWWTILTDSRSVGKAALNIWPDETADVTREAYEAVKATYQSTEDAAEKAACFLYAHCFSFAGGGFPQRQERGSTSFGLSKGYPQAVGRVLPARVVGSLPGLGKDAGRLAGGMTWCSLTPRTQGRNRNYTTPPR